MNERFKQLAQQAKLPDYLLEYGTELCVAPHLERFAKLIIRECMEIADTHQNRGDALSSPLIDDMIAKHFGVEE